MHSVKVLGGGCANCERLATLAGQALDELGRAEQIEKVTDYGQIVAHGVLTTPALMVDGEIVSAGRIPTLGKLKEALAARLD